jgi:hypothetical protein
MNERIKELMEQTGVPLSMPFDKWCEKFAELVAAHEREACAKIAEIAEPYKSADLIRARGTT